MPTFASGFLTTPSGPLAVFAATPETPALRGAVVLCPPAFEERKACATVFTALAETLAGEGFGVLRFDPRGTGDSAGCLADATVDGWCGDAEAVVRSVRATGLPVCLLGIRFGALLATAAHARVPADALVLWEPLRNGADLLRQAVQRKLVNDMAAFGHATADRGSLEAAWDRGETVDLDGYPVSSALHAGLLALTPPPVPNTVPCLVVQTRAGRGADAAVSGLCPGAERQTAALPPFWSLVGLTDVTEAVQAIAAWLRGYFQECHPPRTGAWPPPLEPRWGGMAHVAFPSVRGTRLQAVWQGPDPAAPPVGRKALFLSGWSGCRLGPHNVFVELARELARDGVASLRLDFGGRGDSAGDPREALIASMVEDARTALAWMRGQDPVDAPMSILAICSGCKVAIAAAAADGGIPSLVLWSPEPMGSLRPQDTNRRKFRATLRTYAAKLGRVETWRKLLRGQVRGAMVGKALLRPETRGADEARREDAVLADFRSYRGRVLCVHGGGDPETPGAEAAYEGFFRRNGIPCQRHTIPRAGHSFYRTEWSEELRAVTREWLRACP